MQYLQYQLHVSASTLAIVRSAFNLLSNYTICVVYSGGGDEISFTKVGGMKVWVMDTIANIWCQYRDLTCLTFKNRASYI
jgi:hypothetical protein